MLNQFTVKSLRPKQFFRGLGAAFFSWYCFFKEFYCSSFFVAEFSSLSSSLGAPRLTFTQSLSQLQVRR